MYMSKDILNVEMKIYLDSDLISGSGESWGNRVDTDVTYDQYGFPYIPARRIRGLLKEAAWELEQFQVLPKGTSQQIFGNEEKQGHHFILYNAELKDVHSMKDELDQLKEEYEEFTSPFSILEYYTTMRYQTAIEPDGIAKENSLRSSRAIAKGNVFYSRMECEKEDFDILQKCAVMIHHMGINRTRGFGEVTIQLQEATCPQPTTTTIQLDDDKEYELDLHMKNNSSLSIGLIQSSETLDYIPGSSLLGYFANQYLKNNEVNQTFYDMFVLGKLQFSNAYISDEYWNEYIPIKQSIYKQKVGNTYYDKSIEDNENEILSKVRNKYMSLKGQHALIKDVNKEMVYHHRRPEDKSIGHVVSNDDIKNGMFYQLEVISENQCFIGHIRGQGKYLKEILKYIGETIQIGKSKNTQYGNINIEVEHHETEYQIYKAGEEVILTLVSPLLLLDNKKESILDLQYLAEIFELDHPQFYVDYTKIGGYNAKWQLQKPTYVAFAQGSCIRGILKKDMLQHMIKGALIQEGLGVINIESIEEVRKRNIKKYASKQKTGNQPPKYTKDIILSGVKNKLHLDALQMVDKITIPTVITKTLIGKMLKMADSSWEQFKSDADGIEDAKKQKGVMEFIDKIEETCNQLMKESLLSKDDSYKYEFYLQTLKDCLVHEKLERRDV